MLSFSGPFSCSSSSPDVLSKSRYNHYSLYSQVSEWYQLIFEQQRISENPFACSHSINCQSLVLPKKDDENNLFCWPEAL